MRVIALLLTCSLALLAQQNVFTLAGHSIPSGSFDSFLVSVGETEVPVTVISGSKPGPVLVLTAGIHGDEYPSILALQRLRAEMAAADLSGVLVLVHVANPPAFLGRRIALSPVDEKNLNRVFPGNPTGTLTEKVAHFLTKEVIERADYLIDLHAGSANQELWPHVYSPFIGNQELDRRTLAFAQATGLRSIVLYGDRPRDPARSISCPNTAMTRGKPGLTIEIGHLGQRNEEYVNQVLAAVRNAMRHLRMIPGSEEPNRGFVLYQKLHEVESPVTGIFYPRSRIGEFVDQGALLAVVTDFFGRQTAELRAPARGVVLMINHTPPVRRGDGAVTVAEAGGAGAR